MIKKFLWIGYFPKELIAIFIYDVFYCSKKLLLEDCLKKALRGDSAVFLTTFE